MMIRQIKQITNLAVFQNFRWDNSVKDANGVILDFKTINILYGRNYSGKTTLSRIFRALETGYISDKYKTPSFQVLFDDGSCITERNIPIQTETIRVFNEDFIKENLLFLSDPEKGIESFAVLGDENTKIEQEIQEIQGVLGNNKEGEKTGLYRLQELKQKDSYRVNNELEVLRRDIDDKLSKKATADRNIAIKYNVEYGDLNYNVSKLKNDIELVQKPTYVALSEENKDVLRKILKEEPKNIKASVQKMSIPYLDLVNRTKQLLEKRIGKSEKIDELIKDAILNKWVQEGKTLHEEREKKVCAFCGNVVPDSRWLELDKHFDEESKLFEKEIDEMVSHIQGLCNTFQQNFRINKDDFYAKFHNQVDVLSGKMEDMTNVVMESLGKLQKQLQEKKDNLFDSLSVPETFDFTQGVQKIYEEIGQLIKETIAYTTQLENEQKEAKKALRLQEVADFITTINYSRMSKQLEEKQADAEAKKKEKENIDISIQQKEKDIENKRAQMHDEQKGAEKVNEYLNDFCGHNNLFLKAVELHGEVESKYKFEILREGEKAYHLSEGECSLIAFCYFMARLDDIKTKDKQPIIWIDDPISSLDSNHVFFIYSLINGKIVQAKRYTQLFISTHNLDFLKYLKRLPGANNDDIKAESKKKFRFLLINRRDKISDIGLMPLYMQKYITEFNYLFKQIYDCATIEEISDANYTQFYNFGNNARKFLELYLYYKYPDNGDETEKLAKFFSVSKDDVPPILTNRLNNEYSHLCGVFERGEKITEVPEMKIVAQLIVSTIEKADKEQYEALINSIGA